MRRGITAFIVFFVVRLACQGTLADDQSLGEVARKQRQQQAKKTVQPTKGVTNDDIPEHAPDPPEPEQKPNDSKIASGMNGDQVRKIIQVQKDRITALKAQIEKLRSSIHYVEANRYSNGVEYNQAQQRKQQEVDRMQKQLEGEKSKLETMQESARHAGFGSAIYDP